MDDNRILDCGHPPSPHGEHTTGTAHFGKREICWDCSYTQEKEALKTAKTFSAYLSSDGMHVTTWPGRVLMAVPRQSLRKTEAGFGGGRYYFRALDETGQIWSGNSPGPGMYCRLRKLKS